jgi:peptidylprolyl isomerase
MSEQDGSMMKTVAAAAVAGIMAGGAAQAAGPDDTQVMQLRTGTVLIEMRPDLAPKHVARIKELTRKGFYDGLKFHRVIEGFMAQTGDPKGNGTGGSGQNIDAEFTNTLFVRGTVGMARSQSPNSGDSQFFIMLDRSPHLDGQYTVWGQVVDGMEHVDRIKKGIGAMNGTVQNPDTIVTMRVQADMK